MEQNKFEEFWETEFFPFAKVLCEKFSNLRFDASKKDKIYLKYEGSRQRLRNYMLDPSRRMDRHKVASLLMAAILQIQPFQSGIAFNLQEIRVATIEYMPNEVWAWIYALRVVRSFILARAEQDGDEQSYQMFQAYDCFYFPPCSHGNYQEHVLRSLYHARIKNSFDIFSFSHVLFFVEEYTKLARVSAAL